MNQSEPEAIAPSPIERSPRLWQLAQLFLKLGAIGFGGPQAHIAMQNEEVVVRRNWLTQEQFTEGLAVCEMLPGPASTQMGLYIGYLWAGQLGALVAGLSFIAPAFLIVLALSWGYFRFQGVPQIAALFWGISPVVTAIILAFCWKLGKRTLTDWGRWAIALTVGLITIAFQFNLLVLFVVAGLIGLLLYPPNRPNRLNPSSGGETSGRGSSRRTSQRGLWLPLLPLLPPIPLALPLWLSTVPPESLALSSVWGLERIQAYALPLTTFFLKVGSFIFGGGLVIIPLLEHEVVERLGWLTQAEFINGVAIGQVSPGPVVLTAAFVGYKVAGVLGALVATIAIFAPSFAFIMLASPLLVRLRQNAWMQSFLKGVMPAVLGAIAAAAVPIARTTFGQDTLLHSWGAGMIAIAALVALLRFKTPTWQLILAGGILGLGLSLL